MKDLIERLERASGPDRELDNLIWFYLGQPLPDDCAECPARYTASLDAALPGEMIVDMRKLGGGWIAIALADNGTAHIGESTVSEAIARRIAALKACDFAERDLTKMEAGK